LWGITIAHYVDPTTDRGCAVAIHQLGAGWLEGRPGAVQTEPQPDGTAGSVGDSHEERIVDRPHLTAADPAAGDAVNQLSHFELLLADTMRQSSGKLTLGLERFWSMWQDDGGMRLGDLTAFRAACAEPDGPLILMDRVFGILNAEHFRPTLKQLTEADKNLLRALVLASAERHVFEQAEVGLRRDRDSISVVIRDRLAADMLAAVTMDCGLRLVRHPQDQNWVAANVLRDRAALAYGDPHAARAAWDAELLTLADGGMSADVVLKLARTERPGSPPGPLDPRVVKVALRRMERASRVRPLIAVDDESELTKQPALRAALQEDYGVGIFVHRPLADESDEARRAEQLQSTVLRFVNGVFDAIDPTDAVQASAPPSRHQVFVSYAHIDGDAWRERISLHLQGLGSGFPIDPWDDKRLDIGDDWFKRIEQALAHARCAILVITPGFLASRFICEEEVPRLLLREQRAGLKLLPVLASDCVWGTKPWLKSIQALCGAEALDQLPLPVQNTELARLAEAIYAYCTAKP
jgi:hypothetical protein